MEHPIEQKSSLDVKLAENDAVTIGKVLITVKGITLSAQQMLNQLQQDASSILFQGLKSFLGLTEGIKHQTYRDTQSYMTIGIGLNLEDRTTESLIDALNQKFGLHLNYTELRSTPNLPPAPGLTDAQIDYLF